MAFAVIETRGLTKSYGGVDALQGLDLTVPQHAIFGFLGPNGAGKSTTIKLLLGLIRPSSGTAAIFGVDAVKHSLEIRRRVGYLAQNPRFYDQMTPRETLRFTARFFYKGPAAAIDRRVAEVLEMVGLAEKADRPIKGFSGGERQRLGIAQAYINEPDLLILDEPAAALDPQGRRDVLAIMERLRSRTTIFYSTHILDDVQRVSDQVAILNQGRLVAQAPIGELLGGGGSAVYTVELKGDAVAAHKRVAELPWVREVIATPVEEGVRWQVSVADPGAAESQLLRTVLADPHTTVAAFGRRTANLEEVFLSLVEGGDGHVR